LHLAQAKSNRAPRGRKNDFADAERLVKRLVAHELILSLVPDPEQRLWRTVMRSKYQVRCGGPGIHRRVLETDLLESRFPVRVNAHHLKPVPGRQSDLRDGPWIAPLLPQGWWKGSFLPPPPQREWRRHRTQWVEAKGRPVNRMQKEDANLQRAAIARDILGVSGRARLEALISGQEDPVRLADLAPRKLQGKIPQLEKAGHRRDTSVLGCGCGRNNWPRRRS
jgi:hypothetical protein